MVTAVQAVIIGSDIPDVTALTLQKAIAALRDHQAGAP
jgi:glycosyltransferase A (GT-A) superfamily protein (DUF2064 family)